MVATVLAFVTMMSACASGGHEKRPSASPSLPSPARGDLRPVTDSVPYWCDLVPRRALARVVGVSSGLSEIRDAEASKDSSLCGVKDGERYGPLGVQWDIEGGQNEIGEWAKEIAPDHPVRLPVELGSGFTVYTHRETRLPYFAASTFRCGSRDAWIEIFLRGVSPGRNATKDLVGLMRIAQKRFVKVHRCRPDG
ncbi:hypothetical protein [Actinomadura sp. DC4]|uniref:hypothetical protein n=1 Tax=Actinomadura sp. DC4 TaxID=3055069 RepID=UPI0025AF702B|nr:hypothetical protein [Actinomadura sp. DC4]MDN3352636.1 hypothetical protein [Actinomadura sp. DC4]